MSSPQVHVLVEYVPWQYKEVPPVPGQRICCTSTLGLVDALRMTMMMGTTSPSKKMIEAFSPFICCKTGQQENDWESSKHERWSQSDS